LLVFLIAGNHDMCTPGFALTFERIKNALTFLRDNAKFSFSYVFCEQSAGPYVLLLSSKMLPLFRKFLQLVTFVVRVQLMKAK